jgi:pimeloyl-ACP methyl ester carboxylesterase
MFFAASRVFRRMMSTGPTSQFLTLPNRPVIQANGETAQGPLKLHYWEWKGHKPTILFCHAASFHGRCYDRIINEALHGYHVISLDLRGHGRSQQHPPPYSFRWFAEDVLQFIETLNLPKDNLIGIGHSVGGYTLVWAAAKASRRLFQSLLVLDPVIFSPVLYEDSDDNSFNADFILRRKSQWSSIDDMISRLEKRELFSRWPKDVLRNYCTYALDENFKLVCAPDREASIYLSSKKSEANVYPLIEKSQFINDIPIHIVRASSENSTNPLEFSPTDPDLVKWFKKGRDTQLENVKHLFPMEEPQLTTNLVKEFIEENKKLFSHL